MRLACEYHPGQKWKVVAFHHFYRRAQGVAAVIQFRRCLGTLRDKVKISPSLNWKCPDYVISVAGFESLSRGLERLRDGLCRKLSRNFEARRLVQYDRNVAPDLLLKAGDLQRIDFHRAKLKYLIAAGICHDCSVKTGNRVDALAGSLIQPPECRVGVSHHCLVPQRPDLRAGDELPHGMNYGKQGRRLDLGSLCFEASDPTGKICCLKLKPRNGIQERSRVKKGKTILATPVS